MEKREVDCKLQWTKTNEYHVSPDELKCALGCHAADGPGGRHSLVVNDPLNIVLVTKDGVPLTRAKCEVLWLDWKKFQANYM